jgi:hypothetical protein
MLLSLSLLTFGLCASAAVVPRQTTPCSFSMTTVGPPNGSIVEDTIGENRIGGTYPQGIYTISAHNLTDSLGHKCLIYPSTSQFQCTQGTNGASNFSLADDGSLLFDGKAQWWACPATGPGNDGSFNIFADTKADTTGCEAVTLKTYVHKLRIRQDTAPNLNSPVAEPPAQLLGQVQAQAQLQPAAQVPLPRAPRPLQSHAQRTSPQGPSNSRI